MLTSSQAAALKTYINANYSSQVAAGQIGAIVSALNAQAAGPFVLWRSNIASKEILVTLGATPTAISTLTGAQQFLFLALLLTTSLIDATQANMRAWFGSLFTGTALSNLSALAQRPATVAEEVFSTGTGTAASPAVCSREGPVLDVDVSQALSS